MKITQPVLPIARLHELLRYDAETGLLHWTVRRNQYAVKDAVAGHKADCRGKTYYRVRVDDHMIMGHWIVWAMSYGTWPEDQIDHDDGDGLNNRLSNLRIAPQSENNKNAAIRKDNKTGVLGVVISRCGNFVAHVRVNGKMLSLGTYKTLEEAAAVRAAASVKFGFNPNHGRVPKHISSTV